MDCLELQLKAFADKNRLRIIGLLSKRHFCVCELASILKITQPSVSKHLKKLKKAGIITSSQDGCWTNYSLVLSVENEASSLLGSILTNLSINPQVKLDFQLSKKINREKLSCK